jgi:hypothetical protein
MATAEKLPQRIEQTIAIITAAAEVAKRHRATVCTSPGRPGDCALCKLVKAVYGEP